MQDLTTTNLWLGILTTVVVLQAIGLAVGVYFAVRLGTRANRAIETAERQFAPVAMRAAACIDDLHALSAAALRTERSIRETTDRVGRQVDRVTEIGQHVQTAGNLVLGRFAPVVGAVRAVASLNAGWRARRAQRADQRKRLDAIDEARFVDEGGNSDVART